MAESWLEQARTNGQDITRAELAVTVSHKPLFDPADAGPAERQLEDWNIHNDHADGVAADYDLDHKA